MAADVEGGAELLGGKGHGVSDGGPVFPVPNDLHKDYNLVYPGMSLRDYFAAKALSVIATIPYSDISIEGITDGPAKAAAWCYRVADAMLAERKRANP